MVTYQAMLPDPRTRPGPYPFWIAAATLWLVLGAAGQEAEKQDREGRHKPRELVAALQIRPGDVVADIGTGRGFMLPYLVEAAGPRGKVIAEDIRADFLAQVEQRVKATGWTNVATVLGAEKDPRLPAGALDLALVMMAYHEFEYPGEMLAHIRRALKPEGRLVVVDQQPGQEGAHAGVDRNRFADQIEANGFELVSQFDHAGNQFVLIFRKR